MNHHTRYSNAPPNHHPGQQVSRRLAPHDVGLSAERVAFLEDSNTRASVVDGSINVYVLHRVLHPQVHDNGFKKKRRDELRASFAGMTDCAELRGELNDCITHTDKVL
jgi:hypothetical protein